MKTANFLILAFLVLLTFCKKSDPPKFLDITIASLSYPDTNETDRIKYLSGKVRLTHPSEISKSEIEKQINRIDTLAEYGVKKGWLNDTDVKRKYKQAVVRRFIEKEFDEKFSPDQIPAEFLKKAYQANFYYYNRPELVKVSHILVRCTRIDDEGKHQKALALAGAIKKWAEGNRLNASQFRDLIKTETDLLPPGISPLEIQKQIQTSGLTCIAEALDFFARQQMEKAFSDASFALKNHGDIGGVVKTRYGYHVIFFEARRAPFSKPYESVIPEIRKKIYPDVKRLMFIRFMRDLRKQYRIDIFSGKEGADASR